MFPLRNPPFDLVFTEFFFYRVFERDGGGGVCLVAVGFFYRVLTAIFTEFWTSFQKVSTNAIAPRR